MKNIVNKMCSHIISEPGDYTRYDYIVVKNFDDFSFMPYESSFNFPQKINYWEVQNVTSVSDDIVSELSKKYNCNPYTVMECIRTVKELNK